MMYLVAAVVLAIVALNIWYWRHPPSPEERAEIDREIQVW